MNGKHNFPTIIVVFGATGDLMSRKITPALFHLYKKKKLPPLFRIVGVARRDLTNQQYTEHIRSILSSQIHDAEQEEIDSFVRLFKYKRGNFETIEDYYRISKEMGFIDNEWKICANKLFYLAVPPEHYKTICTYLHESHLTDPCSPEEGWTRVLVEKPFGKDLTTARELDGVLSSLFKEEQIYRIDHYLGKEMLQNILTFRFMNSFLEQSWSGEFIERIDISVLETLGVEKRGSFYDGLGALRDVGQNHLLQMLSLVTMQKPHAFTSSEIRQKRSEILKTLIVPSIKDVASTVRGQYEGYRSITGVSEDSQTETFFSVRARLSHPKWKHVPITLSSGKRFPHTKKNIVVTFKHPKPCLCPPGDHLHNQVIFSLEPEEKITIQFFSKVPGLDLEIAQKNFEFIYRLKEGRKQYVEEYEKLLLDCILGDQTLFVSTQEVEPMWAYTDAIVDGWKTGKPDLRIYIPDTTDILNEHKEVINKPVSSRMGILGLGKMGANLARRLHENGVHVVGYNRSNTVTNILAKEGIEAAYTLEEFVRKLPVPRIVWLMVPSQEIDEVLFAKNGLASMLTQGDLIIDGGNSYYKDTIRRAERLSGMQIGLIDVGFSGGPKGARDGACLMVGGDEENFSYLKPLFELIAAYDGLQFFPGIGAGHFVKMIHNGIEYGMMQSLAEGFAILRTSPFKLDVARVADIYNHGSVIESRLTRWLMEAFEMYGQDLEDISSTVAHTGEGQWTVDTAKELAIKANVIEYALQFRKDSEKNPSYAGKILSIARTVPGA